MANFKTIFTRRGAQFLMQSASSGQAVVLTEMAVGDGNGNPVTPAATQTTLVRERYRGRINRIYQDPSDNTRFTAEFIIPASTDAFTMRELGVFDANGAMIMVGSTPEAYKPAPSEGSYSDIVIAVDFFLTSDANINITLDPDTVVVNQHWLVNNWTAAQLIPGGTVGQVLGKKSNADGAYQWQDPSVAAVTVDTVAETQFLSANQTTIDLAKTTTYGLAVYVAGERLALGSGPDEWQPVANNPTRITLGKAYTAGTKIQLVNNEPAGSAPAPLERAKNLGDVLNKQTARNNLDIFSKGEINTLAAQWAPPGAVMAFARSTPPAGWLACNGAAVSRIAYAPLYAAIGTLWGAGDGFNTFNLPDARGDFIRGYDDGRGVDAGREFATSQAQAIQSHSHTGTVDAAGSHNHSGTTDAQGNHAHSVTGSTSESGGHTHSAWTDAQGNHTHRAWTGYNGEHGHSFPLTNDTGGTGRADGGNPNKYDGEEWTNPSGNHMHDVYMDAAGNHSHNVGIGGVGNHTHSVSGSTSTAGNHAHNLNINANGNHTHTFTTNASGSTETRPRNIAMLYCIKI